MKLTTTAYLLFIFSFFFTALEINAEEVPIEFRGYAKFDGEQFFSLKCTQGRGSAWVRMGQDFYEGRLVEYDPEEEYILFVSNERTFKILLFRSQESYDLISYNKKSNHNDSKKMIRKKAPTGGVPRVETSRSREEKITVKNINFTK